MQGLHFAILSKEQNLTPRITTQRLNTSKGLYTWSRLTGMDFLPRSASMKETPRIFLILYMGSFKTSRPAEMFRESPGTPRVTRIHDEASRILVISHPTEMKLSHPCHVNGYPEIILTSQTPLPAYLNSEGCFYCQDIAGVPKLQQEVYSYE